MVTRQPTGKVDTPTKPPLLQKTTPSSASSGEQRHIGQVFSSIMLVDLKEIEGFGLSSRKLRERQKGRSGEVAGFIRDLKRRPGLRCK